MWLWLLTKLPWLAGIAGGPVIEIALLNLRKFWIYYVIGGLVAFSIITSLGWSHAHTKLVAEKLAHQTDITNFRNTQALANANAKAEADRLEKEGTDKANAADKNYSTLLAEYHSNLLRFKANQSHPGQAGNSELQTTQSSNRPSSDTNLLTITLDDAQICATNTARLQAVHDWAVGLPQNGDN